MQLPVSVPANGGPLITAAVTRPVGAKVTLAVQGRDAFVGW